MKYHCICVPCQLEFGILKLWNYRCINILHFGRLLLRTAEEKSWRQYTYLSVFNTNTKTLNIVFGL
jgi:hypothetical protein